MNEEQNYNENNGSDYNYNNGYNQAENQGYEYRNEPGYVHQEESQQTGQGQPYPGYGPQFTNQGQQNANGYQQGYNNGYNYGYQQNGYQQPYNNPNGFQRPESQALGIVSMILGIVAVILCCPPFNIIIAIAALVTGIVYLAQKKKTGKGFAIAGIVTGAIALLFGIGLILMVMFLPETDTDYYSSYDEQYWEDFFDEYMNDTLEDNVAPSVEDSYF